ncbi:MAG: hypothetical protein JO265_12505 [Acidimicrobiia bacterium]|nr:hypothetical protein [Acidimicrobiia bacterium]
MFQLPTLQPCDGLPLWLTAEDDVTQALVLWWRSGTAWVVHGPSSGPGVPSDDQVDAA